jgi:hypothetical protein
MTRTVDTDTTGNPFELLPSRVSWMQVTLHMPKQGWHLTKYIVRRRDVEDLSLCSVEVARRSLDKGPISEDPEPRARLWRLRPSRLPGCVKMTLNRRH